MKIKFDIFNFCIFISSLISFVVTLFYFKNFAAGYQMMIIFPLSFLIIYFFILQNLRNKKLSFTIYGIIVMQWIRFVLMPPVCAISGENAGFSYINPTTTSLKLATILMMYELLIISIFSAIWFSSSSNNYINKRNDRLLLKGNNFIYFVYILLVIGVLFSIGRQNKLLNFIYIPIEGKERIGDLTDTYLVLARQIVIVGLFLIFLCIVSYCKSAYEKSNKKKYVIFSIIAALLNVSIIVGERRTAQIYTASICVWILINTFPKYKRKILFSIGSMALVILSLMSVYKFFAAFQYDSYMAALSNSNADIAWFSRTLQSYFFGPENVAAVIDFSNIYDISIINMIYDFFRSIFGISFLMKGKGVLTSEIFNTYIYGTVTATGHVVSAIGYGYLYFGILLSPIIATINIIISSKIEKKMYTSNNYEMTYIWGYILLRFSTNLFVNTLPLISYSTIMLGTGGLLFSVAIILKINKKIWRCNYKSSDNLIES